MDTRIDPMEYLLDFAVVLDTETTGLDHKVDRLVELALLEYRSDGHYSSLCYPGRDIPPEAMAIHHITEAMVANEPQPARALYDAVTLLNRPKLAIAHNAKFDLPFINDLAQGQWDPIWVCTYKCAVMTWPEAPAHTNQVLRYWLGLKAPLLDRFPGLAPHRALYDIIITREIFRTLLVHNTLEQLITWSSGPLDLPKVPFGKHKGKKWSEVDYGYLKWILNQGDMDENMIHSARNEVARRYK